MKFAQKHVSFSQINPRSNELAVVSCYFNPAGYQRNRENFQVFFDQIERAEVEYQIAELSFDAWPFELPPRPGIHRIRGGSLRHQLWQKERLLNLMIGKVSATADVIAWIDADVIFQNPDWVSDTCRALEQFPVVQLFDDAVERKRDGTLRPLRPSVGWAYHNGKRGRFDLSQFHPGFAWAGRASWLKRYGLTDFHVVGAGDAISLAGFCDCETHTRRLLNSACRVRLRAWSQPVRQQIRGRMSFVPGQVHHLYHGNRRNRGYLTRHDYLNDHDFDPDRDIEIDPETGLWQWTDSALHEKSRMVSLVRNYFSERKEDD